MRGWRPAAGSPSDLPSLREPSVTTEQRALLDKFAEWERANGVDFEDFLEALSVSFAERAPNQGHPAVQGCFESISDHLSEASLAFYVSTK